MFIRQFSVVNISAHSMPQRIDRPYTVFEYSFACFKQVGFNS